MKTPDFNARLKALAAEAGRTCVEVTTWDLQRVLFTGTPQVPITIHITAPDGTVTTLTVPTPEEQP